jgi:hypothetical protein
MFFLSACNQKFEFSEELINQNIMHSYIEKDYNDITIRRVSFTDAQNSTLNGFTIEYQSQGLVILTNMNGQKAVYSIIEDKFLINFGDYNITIGTNSANGAYIYVYYPDQTRAVYDIKGVRVVPKDEYHNLEIVGYYEYQRDEYNNITGYENYERITTLTKSDFESGVLTPTVKTYSVDFENKTRTHIEDIDDANYNVGDKLGLETLNATPLDLFGLEDYYMTTINDVYRIYNKDFELVSQFNIPSGSTMTARLIFDGTVLYQTQTKVPETEENYTFINNNQKYVLNTYKIDMLTGQTESIDLDYAISSYKYLKNENQAYAYGRISAYPIESRILKVDALNHFIINSDGKILDQYNTVIDDQLRRLDESTIYNETTYTLYDNNLNPLFKVSPDAVFDTQEKLIITRHDNRLGVVNYQGEVLIPFNYISINSLFYNGYTMAYNGSSEQVLIGIDGSEVKLDIYNTFDIPGVYIPFTSNDTYVFYDYQMNELFSLSSVATSITKHQISHPLLKGYILDFNKSGSYDYVIIEYS